MYLLVSLDATFLQIVFNFGDSSTKNPAAIRGLRKRSNRPCRQKIAAVVMTLQSPKFNMVYKKVALKGATS